MRFVAIPGGVGAFLGAVVLSNLALDAARRENARLLFLSNPDNPMGTWWRAQDVSGLINALPEGTLLCLDEAYCEFAPPEALPPFDVGNPQVLRFRTFSKAYGMAGARIAYAIGEARLVRSFDKIRNHFGVNRIAQAGALAALSDEGHLAKVIAEVATGDPGSPLHGGDPTAVTFQDGVVAIENRSETLADLIRRWHVPTAGGSTSRC